MKNIIGSYANDCTFVVRNIETTTKNQQMKRNPTAELSDKKKKLLEEKNNSPITVGERVGVKAKILYPDYTSTYKGEKGERVEIATVLEVLPENKIKVVEGDGSVKTRGTVIIGVEEINNRDISRVGANPINEDQDDVRTVAFTLDSVIFSLSIVELKKKPREEGEKIQEGINAPFKINGIDILDLNWNPFVYGKDGKKIYFQRPFVWTLEDKQNLIDSIYQRIDCGRILIRKRSWNEVKKMADAGEKELFWNDIIDGKQRLNAVGGFIRGEYPDSQGNYYNDLSFYAQHELTGHQLFGYSEMPDESSDESVIRQFLKLNFCGVPQSREHIEFVKSIQKII